VLVVAIIGIFAVVVLVVAASDLSGSRRASRSATLASVGGGLVMLLVASLQLLHTQRRVNAGETMHLKHGVFEPWQAYGAYSGILLTGVILIAVGALRWHRGDRGERTI
jgi:Na+-driven multidrug efflux pump